MKSLLILTIALLIARVHAGTTEAESGVFEFDTLTHGTSPVMADTDGDGQGDAAELAAGTDPLAGDSCFAAAMGPVAPGASASVFWNGVAGRSYRVLRSSELGTLNLDFLKTGVEGIDGAMTFQDQEPPAGRAFYWIEVE